MGKLRFGVSPIFRVSVRLLQMLFLSTNAALHWSLACHADLEFLNKGLETGRLGRILLDTLLVPVVMALALAEGSL